MSEQETFGRWVRRRRARLDLTQRALAEQVGCATITIRKIEADQLRPSRQVASRLGDALELQPAERAAFAAAARGERYHHTPLPAPLTPLVGRDEAAAAVSATLMRAGVRLLTLSGPPGIGKTSLALRVAIELQPRFADGAVWVALADVRGRGRVVEALGAALGLHQAGDRPLQQRLHEALRDRELLLVLDNFEHVLAAAPEVAALLGAAPRVKALVTSRAVLRITGEHPFPLAPLDVPDTRAPLTLAAVARSSAVQLFVQRAQAVDPAWRLTDANAPAVAAICARLDGLPLAIELAAARTRLWPAEALLQRLSDPATAPMHRLLVGGRRDQPARQQTLRAAIEWSYRLLSREEQHVFRQLGVFAGGFTLAAAETVVADGAGQPMASRVGEVLEALLDNSLVQAQASGTRRFRMLQTLREHALALLEASGEADAVRERHARYVLALARSAERACYSAERLHGLEEEHANVRAALAWFSRPGVPVSVVRVEQGLRLARALDRFWFARGHVGEGRHWLAQLLALAGEAVAAPERAVALSNAGFLAWFQSDCAAAAEHFDAARALFETLGDRTGQAWSLLGLARVARFRRDYRTAEAYFETSFALFSAAADRVGCGWAANELGQVALMQEQNARAVEHFNRSHALFEASRQLDGTADALWGLGSAALAKGQYAEAAARYTHSLALWRTIGEKLGSAGALAGLGSVALVQRDGRRAGALLRESLAIHWELGNTWGLLQDLVALAAESAHRASRVQRGRSLERAVLLLGAVDALQHRSGAPLWPVYRALQQQTLAQTRAQLSVAAFAAAWAEGSSMPLPEVIGMVQH